MLGLLSCALNRVIIELCQEKSSNHEKHGWNFYAKVVFLQPLFLFSRRTLFLKPFLFLHLPTDQFIQFLESFLFLLFLTAMQVIHFF